MWNLKNRPKSHPKLKDTEKRPAIAGRGHKTGKGDQKAQTSSYKCHGHDVPCNKYNELCCALYMKVANRVNPKRFKNYIYIHIAITIIYVSIIYLYI